MSRVKEVIITSGIPGAGKSTWVRENTNPYMTEIFSADNFFLNEHGTYVFEPKELPEAHATCLKDYTLRLIDLVNSEDNSCDVTLVIDNTNTSAWEIAPYYSLAEAFNVPVRIVRLLVSPKAAHSRNIHGVDREKVEIMSQRMIDNPLPPFWHIQIIEK